MSDLTSEDVQAIVVERQRFQSVINDAYVFAEILNDCNYFSMDPETIDPALIAHCNRLMGRIGIVTPTSLDRVAQALLDSAVANDFEEVEDVD